MVHDECVRQTAILPCGRELCIQRSKSHGVNAATYGHAQPSPAALEVPSVPAGLFQSGFELIARDGQARLLAVPPGVAPCRSRGSFPQADDIASPHKRRIKVQIQENERPDATGEVNWLYSAMHEARRVCSEVSQRACTDRSGNFYE